MRAGQQVSPSWLQPNAWGGRAPRGRRGQERTRTRPGPPSGAQHDWRSPTYADAASQVRARSRHPGQRCLPGPGHARGRGYLPGHSTTGAPPPQPTPPRRSELARGPHAQTAFRGPATHEAGATSQGPAQLALPHPSRRRLAGPSSLTAPTAKLHSDATFRGPAHSQVRPAHRLPSPPPTWGNGDGEAAMASSMEDEGGPQMPPMRVMA